ncbi:MAG: dehydrogenase E1 component subunit alpha/beta [Candidatus Binatia bacterium]|nr:dehydrogenase E1 component subunit alpha/beta [Candidatus Binatia bacterium]
MSDTSLERGLYRTVRRIRCFDDRMRGGIAKGEFLCSYWPVEGQEGISAGVVAALEPEDQMVITYRCAADAIAKGVRMDELAGELLGRSIGTSGGRGGAMGISAPDVGLMATTGIVGSGAPIGNGLALAAQLADDGRVVVASFGDGATSIGAVHEAMNLASLWDLPIVFLCHNNLFGEGTPVEEYTRSTRLSDRAAGYRMPGVTVDGTDAVAVYEAAREAVDRARSGGGPTFLEAVAFRLNGHYFGDPCEYVDPGEREAARAKEPVGRMRKRLEEAGVSAAEIENIDSEVDAEVEGAFAAVGASAEPSAEDLYGDIYAGRSDPGCLASTPRPAAPVFSGETDDLTYAEAINKTLDDALARDDRVILLGEDIADPVGGLFKCTAGLSTKHGRDRVRPTPIAEQAIMGAAIGAALAGMRPVPELMFVDFLAVCLDQIANHAAKMRYMSGGRVHVPLTIRTMVGVESGAQHSQSLEAWLLHTPGLKVVIPSTPADAKGLLSSCLEDPDPCVFIESRPMLLARKSREPVPRGDYRVPLGLASVRREGSDVTVVAWGLEMPSALEAAEALQGEGVSVEVIDPRTLVPFDLETVVESVRRTRRLVVAHRATQFCGFGAEIAALVTEACFRDLAAPVERVGGGYAPVPRAASLETVHTPRASTIADGVRRVLAKS